MSIFSYDGRNNKKMGMSEKEEQAYSGPSVEEVD